LKLLTKNILAISLILIFSPGVNAKNPKVEKSENGFYNSWVDRFFYYRVDTVTQLCFAAEMTGGRALIQISCENLAKRPEWVEIITWLGKSHNKSVQQNAKSTSSD